MSERPPREARRRLILALDRPDLDEARRLAESCAAYFATVKVGLELFSAAGPEAVRALVADGFAVFVDLKLHDIPTTVRRAAAALAALGASFATVHAAGGLEMLVAAQEGLDQGAPKPGAAVGLGVTTLTSEVADEEVLLARATLASEAGLGGIVCGVPDLGVLRSVATGLLRVVPGIRPAGDSVDDQRRRGTPEQAIRLGADLLVVGRPVSEATDPRAAAAAIAEAVEQA